MSIPGGKAKLEKVGIDEKVGNRVGISLTKVLKARIAGTKKPPFSRKDGHLGEGE
ncbi:MAG: hypothetical protein AB9866_12900 [Syntrophobacteraceae bacterium]